jgi:hypothetical protein
MKYFLILWASVILLTFSVLSPGLAQNDSFSKKQSGIESLKSADFQTAAAMAAEILRQNPSDFDAYHLLVMSQEGQNDFQALILTVASAEKKGIRSSILYQKQAEAFYRLGMFEAGLQSLSKMEDIWVYEQSLAS